MLKMFPELLGQVQVRPVRNYPQLMRRSLEACAPSACEDRPAVGVLNPGFLNSAYFDHSFLAEQMGAELVEHGDLQVVTVGWPCGPLPATNRLMCSTGGSTMTFSIHSHSVLIRCNIDELVIKEVHGSGGYGILVGPAASKAEIAAFTDKRRANPAARHRALIATLEL